MDSGKNIFIFIILFFTFTLSGCATSYNLATEQDEFVLMGEAKEVSIGEAIAKKVEQEFEVDEDMDLQARVQGIGGRVAAVCDRKTIEYHFKVISHEEDKSAFALPGGWVYIFRGLIDELETDDEIAAVLAHEVGHISARHSAKRWQSSLGYTALIVIVAGSETDPRGKIDIANALNQLFLSYSRADEILADKLAVKYLARAQYNPEAMVAVLNKLREIHREEPLRRYTSARTHPYLTERIGRVKKEIFGKMDFEDYINLSEETKDAK